LPFFQLVRQGGATLLQIGKHRPNCSFGTP
jgi:hypothetical protein